MPKYYNIETTKDAIKFVDSCDFTGIKQYILNGDIKFKRTFDPHRIGIPNSLTGEIPFDKQYKFYHIASYAVDMLNIEVLKFICSDEEFPDDDFYLNWYPHGNSYNLSQLAENNLTEEDNAELIIKRKEIVSFLKKF